MGCCNSRNEMLKGKAIVSQLPKQTSRPSVKRGIIDIIAKGRTFSKNSLVSSVANHINLKRAILLTIENLEDSEKFLRDTTSLDNKEIDLIRYSALKVTKYFK